MKTEAAIIVTTELVVRHLGKNGKEIQRRVIKNKKVTNAFVYDIVDVLKGTSGKFDLYKWHDSGISTIAESATQIALGSRVSTNLIAGTQAEGGSSNIYKSVATKTYTSTKSITEHGLFNASSTATYKLMDRTLFAAINVSNGESIEFTFQITFSSGG